MLKYWKPFAAGAATMLVLVLGIYAYIPGFSGRSVEVPAETVSNTVVPPDTVTITPLPPQQIMRGTEVPFEGRTELKQAIAGRFARKITIVNFQAAGENAEKSTITIAWENGEVDIVSPGTRNKQFSPERRAVSITVNGYSVHERKLFKDSNRKGTLTWELRCEPLEI